MRFTVHDSSDYYQLKVSVFNDDRKTDLIGETWIDLRDIIICGGGQSDQWHNLNYRGKYAGEVRIEITYYDSRPKPEKPAPKPKPAAAETDGTAAPQQRSTPKRRPLPSDPVTGQPPSPSVPHHNTTQTPPRPQANPPSSASYVPDHSTLQAVEYSTSQPQPRYQNGDNYASGPPSGGGAGGPYTTPNHRMDPPSQQHRSVDRYDRGDKHALHAENDHDYSPAFHAPSSDRYDHPDSRNSYDPNAGQDAYDLPPASMPMDDPRGLPTDDDRPPPPPVHRSRNNSAPSHELVHRASYETPPKGTPPTMRQDVLRSEAHRSSVSNAYPGQRPQYKHRDSALNAAQVSPYSSGDPHQPSPPRYHSYDPAYEPQYHSMQPTVEDAPESSSPLAPQSFRHSASRRPEYDDPGYDLVPSPAPLNLGGRDSGASGQYHSQPTTPHHHWHHDSAGGYGSATSPAAHRDHSYTSPTPGSYGSHQTRGRQYANQRGELDGTEIYSTSAGRAPPPMPVSLVPGIDHGLASDISDRIYEEHRHEQRRYTTSMMTPTRARQSIDIPQGYANSSPQPYATPQHAHGGSPGAYSAGGHSGGPSPSPGMRRSVSPNPILNPIPSPSTSPSNGGQLTIKRKSVSPAPPPDPRRLSGVPFSPDAYDALNPTAAAASEQPTRPDFNDASGKIITYDGREIDPSDHLPVETWAPEPEAKPPKEREAATSSRPAPGGAQPMPPSGRRPLRIAARPSSMAAPPPAAPVFASNMADTPPPPAATGRNRLQKKSNRASAMPVMMSGPGPSAGPGPSHGPLAPLLHDNHIPPHHHSQYHQQQQHRGPLPRASTYDLPNENHGPLTLYGSSPGSGGGGGGGRYRSSSGVGPPPGLSIPTKEPVMSGALPASSPGPGGSGGGGYGGAYDARASRAGGGGGGWELTLAEEMSRIDIGTGRARRHGGP